MSARPGRAVAIAMCLAALPGCSSSPPQQSPQRTDADSTFPRARTIPIAGLGADVDAPLRARVDRVFAPAGGVAAIAVTAPPPRTSALTAPIVRLSSGPALRAELRWIGLAPALNPDDPEDHWRRWLGPMGPWIERTADQPPTARELAAGGGWFLLVELPPTIAANETLDLDGYTHPLIVLTPPQLAPVAIARPLHIAASHIEPWAIRLAQHPIERARLRLISLRLADPASDASRRILAALTTPDDSPPGVAAIAAQMDRLWITALERMHADDPGIAAQVVERLTTIVTLGEDRAAPAWAVWNSDLRELLEGAAAAAQPGRAAALASIWLSRRAQMTTWVIDDAGAAHPSGAGAIVTIGMADLQGRADLAWLRTEALGRPTTGVRSPVRPYGWTPLVSAVDAALPAARVDVVAGERVSQVYVVTGAVPAAPPGLVVAPLLQTWTMESWLAETPQPGLGDRATACLLQRSATGAGWELYIECRVPIDAAPGSDLVRLWMGPTQSPAAVLTLTREGSLHDALSPSQPARFIPVDIQPDRWSAIVPIPDSAIEDRGAVLRLGVERIDALGLRSAWPRPTLPWQRSPGRLAVDLRAWTDITSLRDEAP